MKKLSLAAIAILGTKPIGTATDLFDSQKNLVVSLGYIGCGGTIDTETQPILAGIFGWVCILARLLLAVFYDEQTCLRTRNRALKRDN